MTLGEWLEKNGVSVAEFAARVGVSRQAVAAWRRGAFYPSARHLRVIDIVTGGQVGIAAFVPREAVAHG